MNSHDWLVFVKWSQKSFFYSLRSCKLRTYRSQKVARSIIHPSSKPIYLSRHLVSVNTEPATSIHLCSETLQNKTERLKAKNCCCNTPILCSAWNPFDKWMYFFFTGSLILFIHHLKCAINYHFFLFLLIVCFFFLIFCQSRGKLVKLSKSDLNEHYLHMQIGSGFPLAINLSYMNVSTFLLPALHHSQQVAGISQGRVLLPIFKCFFFLLFESEYCLIS